MQRCESPVLELVMRVGECEAIGVFETAGLHLCGKAIMV